MTFEQKLKSKIERERLSYHTVEGYRESHRKMFENGANLLAPLLVEAYAAIDLLIHRLNEVNRDYVNANIGKQVVERDMEKAHKTIVKINQFTQE